MKIKNNHIAFLVFFTLLNTLSSLSQNSLDGILYDYQVLPNNDTLMTIRNPGDWWYGLTGGVNANIFYGDLKIPSLPNYLFPDKDTINLVSFSTKTSISPWVGLMTEYKPNGSNYAIFLGLNLYDARSISTDNVKDKVDDRYYTFSMNYTYASVSPGFRYDLTKSLFLLTSLSIEYLLSNKQNIEHHWNNDINKSSKIVPTDPLKYRFGVNLGFGYDFTFLDINRKYRAKFSPYILFGVGTAAYTGYKSNTNQFLVRLGFQVKMGKDNAIQETLPGNPDAIFQPGDLAQLKNSRNISFTLPSNSLVAFDIRPFSNSIVNIEEDTTKSIEITGTLIPDEKTEKVEIVYNRVKPFYSPAAENTKVTKSLQTYLDEFVKTWQKDRSILIDVVGYSDNQGSFEVNESRARERTKLAVDYLVKKGVPRLNIYDRVGGSRNTGENQFTADGRRKSRRVDISIRKAPKK